MQGPLGECKSLETGVFLLELSTAPSFFLLGLEPSTHCCSTCTVNYSLVRLLWAGIGDGEEHQAAKARATDHWRTSPPSFHTVLSP